MDLLAGRKLRAGAVGRGESRRGTRLLDLEALWGIDRLSLLSGVLGTSSVFG